MKIETCSCYFFIIKPTTGTNFPNLILSRKNYMFLAFPLPIIRSFLLYVRHWYISCKSDDSFQGGSGWNVFHPDPAWKLSSDLQEIYQCRMYSRKLLMMGKGNALNM